MLRTKVHSTSCPSPGSVLGLSWLHPQHAHTPTSYNLKKTKAHPLPRPSRKYVPKKSLYSLVAFALNIFLALLSDISIVFLRTIQTPKTMSIVPIGNQDGTIANPFSLNSWDPEDFFTSINRWDPFQNLPFPSLLPTPFPSFSRQTQVNWRETSRAHVFRAVFPGFGREDVLVYIDDDNMLQISTEDGNFMSKFKMPDNARRDQLNADMVNGVLTVTIPKEEVARHRPNVGVVEIEGSG